MKSNIKEIRIQVRVSQDELDRIDEYARRAKMQRSTMLRSLLLSGMDGAEFMNKVGIYDLVSFFRENDITPIDLHKLAENVD